LGAEVRGFEFLTSDHRKLWKFQDGNGASFYRFGDRKQSDLNRHFGDAARCNAIHSQNCKRENFIVQMVAFSEPDKQLPALEHHVGSQLREINVPGSLTGTCSRTGWRTKGIVTSSGRHTREIRLHSYSAERTNRQHLASEKCGRALLGPAGGCVDYPEVAR
jgi:hypothetical protein